jgi:predicted site-specific integrase-resolvase
MMLTYWQAAKRVRRHPDTIKRWRRDGLLRMTLDAKGRRVVELDELLRCWRERMANDPAHNYRLRGNP